MERMRPNVRIMKRRGIQQTSVGKVTPQPPPERPGAALQMPVRSLDQALAVAGLLGTEFELSILVQLGIAPEWLDACFDGGHWIELAPGRARFADPSMQLRTVECLTWSERRRWHGRIASTLEKIRASLPEVAFHYSAAHLYEKARRAWMAAARVACQAGQYGDALRSLRQALAVWPVDEAESERRNVLREIARCARNIRDLAVARNAWQELSEQAERQADWVTGLEAARQLAELSKLAGDTSSTRQYLQAAIDCARRSGDERERARSLLALAEFLIDRVRLNAAREVLQEARKAAGMAQCPALESEIIGWAGLLDAMQGRHAAARAQVDAALQMALRHQLNEQVALAYRRLANLRDYDADFAGERDLHLRAIAFCRKQRMRDGANACMSCLAYAFFRTGEWKRAMDTATQVLRQTRVPPLLHTIALSVQALIATFRGERRRAARLLETSLERTRRENVVALEFHLLWAQACMAEADHELDRARHIHEEIRALWNETDDRHDAVPAFLSAAFLHSDQNDRAGIHQVLDLLHRIARDNPTAQAQAARAAVEGELAGMEGDLARSHRLFQDAVKGYDELGSPVERAMVRHRWLRALRREQRHGEADRVKKEAVGLAQSLGMRLLLEPPDLSPTITDTAGSAAAPLAGGLTRRQCQVLRLVAQGLINKEIADRLDLSPRTVEMHVARTLERLHCRTRAEATRRASALGILE
jgi:DNA-binding CsgD family transcriptional regulator/tetratricopeptide (TPR) repeat protein